MKLGIQLTSEKGREFGIFDLGFLIVLLDLHWYFSNLTYTCLLIFFGKSIKFLWVSSSTQLLKRCFSLLKKYRHTAYHLWLCYQTNVPVVGQNGKESDFHLKLWQGIYFILYFSRMWILTMCIPLVLPIRPWKTFYKQNYNYFLTFSPCFIFLLKSPKEEEKL